jgi:glyoxylase-like metal-dependent hydrolase (beta-lactamase superfamily II)
MPSVTPILTGHLLTSDQGNPAFCSVLLVESAGRRALFDCGHAGRRRYLLAGLAAQGLTPADIDQVVISHAHWDHVQNADLFPDAEILIHPDELRYLDDPPPTDLGTPRWARGILDGMDLRTVVEGDEVLPEVRVLELPGHTPGSIGLLAGHAVLAADAVPTLAVLHACRASGHPYDQELADASVEKVVTLAEVVYPGHDRTIRLDPDGEFEYAEIAQPLAFRVP